MKFLWKASLCLVLACITSTAIAADAPDEMPTMQEMWLLIQQQQQAITNLEKKLAVSESQIQDTSTKVGLNTQSIVSTKTQVSETRDQLEMTADAIDTIMVSDDSAISFGGYGEMHYNNLDSGNEMDFHRFVMFTGYRFSDSVRFFSELEVEHSIAGDGKNGEVELEQAYIQWDFADNHHSKGGLFLLPVGIINETHEPNTFYGVERNDVEKNIVPATWWEGGLSLSGELAPGWSYDVALHSGINLDTDNSSASKRTSVRSARQKVSKAATENLAYTGRIRYTGIPGFSWGLTAQYQDDVTQSDDDGIGISGIDGVLLETNFVFERGSFAVRGLYAQWAFDDTINQLNDGADEQSGWYLEPSFKLTPRIGFFTRYSQYDLTAGASRNSEKSQLNLGLNFWLDPSVVMKLDVQKQDNDNGVDNDGFNLGIGYSF